MLKNRKVCLGNLGFLTLTKVCVGNLGFLTLTLFFIKIKKNEFYFL